jgi:hypothetical protein
MVKICAEINGPMPGMDSATGHTTTNSLLNMGWGYRSGAVSLAIVACSPVGCVTAGRD